MIQLNVRSKISQSLWLKSMIDFKQLTVDRSKYFCLHKSRFELIIRFGMNLHKNLEIQKRVSVPTLENRPTTSQLVISWVYPLFETLSPSTSTYLSPSAMTSPTTSSCATSCWTSTMASPTYKPFPTPSLLVTYSKLLQSSTLPSLKGMYSSTIVHCLHWRQCTTLKYFHLPSRQLHQ